ncbi:hypothetical protein AAEI00_21915, partial [Shewanella algae]|uniref:SixA phosphatase family protein n=1 Tax=Shewanella algae TaxID=38313 RepID=UPI00318ED5BE
INRNVAIDAFVSSTANRALTTAIYFAKTFGKKQTDIITVPELYHASTTTFYQVVKKLNNAFQTVALFSHNPGITDFVN